MFSFYRPDRMVLDYAGILFSGRYTLSLQNSEYGQSSYVFYIGFQRPAFLRQVQTLSDIDGYLHFFIVAVRRLLGIYQE
jgi:hypothetical protein